MSQQPNASEPPLPPWANRRMRGMEVPRRLSHSWSSRRTSGGEPPRSVEPPETVDRPPAVESALTRAAEELLAEAEAEASVPTPLPAGGAADGGFGAFDRAIAALTGDDLAADSLAEAELLGGDREARSRPSVRRLGAGLVALPRVQSVDPVTALLADPEVPEPKRFCWKCQAPVGRGGRNGGGVVVGECERCRSPFNFRPALEPGEVVADQYVVKGCLAHGGLGWIYLAIDSNVSDRWVVLKGLQNPQDFEAHVVALAERQFLSEVTHPGIVKIYNFVKHRSTRDVSDGYIVMEYVGGRSLKKLQEMAAPDRIPVAEVLAYMMEVLPALDYLHSFGLAYNDLKPDNIMVTEDEVKLIDLGAVAAMESYGSIYGTPGYQAPEIIETGPTVASDIYTAGRTLAALILDLPKDDNGNYRTEVPTPERHSLLRRYPFVYRLLLRATHSDPARRFPSAYAMYCQLAGVLRMVLAADTGREHPQVSVEFGSLRSDFGTDTLIGQTDGMVDGGHRMPSVAAGQVVAALPIPLIDADDPSEDLLSTLLHGDPRHSLDALLRTRERIAAGTIDMPETFELEGTLAAVRAHLDLGEVAPARERLAELRSRYETDWRLEWYAGIADLLDEQYERAYLHFDEVHTMLPGEIAPALALAATAELVLQHLELPGEANRWHRAAVEYYRLVWQTNHEVVSAAFGLARRLAADGKPLEAVAVLDQVPMASRHYGIARMTGSLLLVSRPVAEITEADIIEAASRLSTLLREPRALQMQVVVVGAALEWLRARRRPAAQDTTILGFPLTEWGLRGGLETCLRALARTAPDRLHRYRLVDLANSVRPHTLW